MLRSFANAHAVDLGFDADPLLTMRLQLPQSKYAGGEERRAFFDRLEPRLAALAGIEAAAITTGVPPLDGGERLMEVDAPAAQSGAAPVFVSVATVTPRFFEVLGVPLRRGRALRRSRRRAGRRDGHRQRAAGGALLRRRRSPSAAASGSRVRDPAARSTRRRSGGP